VTPWIVLASLVLEAVLGYPPWLHARLPHPVVWVGKSVAALEQRWNRTQYSDRLRRLLGCAVVLIIVCAAVLAGLVIEDIKRLGIMGVAAVAVVGTVGLAQRSLFVHVDDVLKSLRARDLRASRQRVSLIVGRETAQLDADGVSAAALESLAESFNDGIVAPAFWFLVGGLPGLFAYKVLNTADSLIGHKEECWRAFGWAAARADDVANLVPARLAGLLLIVAGGGGLSVMLRDASKHASPNAGWPEAAMAGALGVSLGGSATYDGVLHERPVFGAGARPTVDELARGLRIYVRACGLLWLLVAAVGALWPL
jgi:adenosylcobinamide-phosphate synthase